MCGRPKKVQKNGKTKVKKPVRCASTKKKATGCSLTSAKTRKPIQIQKAVKAQNKSKNSARGPSTGPPAKRTRMSLNNSTNSIPTTPAASCQASRRGRTSTVRRSQAIVHVSSTKCNKQSKPKNSTKAATVKPATRGIRSFTRGSGTVAVVARNGQPTNRPTSSTQSTRISRIPTSGCVAAPVCVLSSKKTPKPSEAKCGRTSRTSVSSSSSTSSVQTKPSTREASPSTQKTQDSGQSLAILRTPIAPIQNHTRSTRSNPQAPSRDPFEIRRELDEGFEKELMDYKLQKLSDIPQYQVLEQNFHFWNVINQSEKAETWKIVTTESHEVKMNHLVVRRLQEEETARRFLRDVREIEDELLKLYFDEKLDRNLKQRARDVMYPQFLISPNDVEEYLKLTIQVSEYSEVIREYHRRKNLGTPGEQRGSRNDVPSSSGNSLQSPNASPSSHQDRPSLNHDLTSGEVILVANDGLSQQDQAPTQNEAIAIKGGSVKEKTNLVESNEKIRISKSSPGTPFRYIPQGATSDWTLWSADQVYEWAKKIKMSPATVKGLIREQTNGKMLKEMVRERETYEKPVITEYEIKKFRYHLALLS